MLVNEMFRVKLIINFYSNFSSFSFQISKMMENPWQVDSIESFTYLKCPECVFDTKEKTCFQNHAIENHPLSHVLFGKKGNNLTILNFDPNGFNSEYTEKSEKLRTSTNLHETSMLKEQILKIKNIETKNSLGEIISAGITEERKSKDNQQNSISDGFEKKLWCNTCDVAFLSEYSLKSHIESRYHDIEVNVYPQANESDRTEIVRQPAALRRRREGFQLLGAQGSAVRAPLQALRRLT